MTYREALAWLFGTQLFGIKLGLENIERLLRALNVPSPEQRIIHVAGTNGKGSVCAMIDSILRAQGYRSGLFTSPHLVTFRERIQVNGEMIGEKETATGLTSIRDLIADWDPHPTFFEIATALALRHFKEAHCEILVLETGMGGRLDATNAITPVVSVITPIDYDHQKYLGNSLGEIAAEKAGIIKTRVPIVSSPQPAEAENVIRARARECEAPLKFVSSNYGSGPIALPGSHQKQNAAVAIAATRAGQIEISEQAIVAGLSGVNWPARFQRWDDRTVIDGAHNPAGARVLAETWRDIFGEEKATLVLAVLQDKDVAGICRNLLPIASRAFLPQIRSTRAMPPAQLEKIFREVSATFSTAISSSLDEALVEAHKSREPVLIAGSLHFAGEAIATLQGLPAAFEECAQ